VAITREQLKKLIKEEMVKKDLNEGPVTNWISSQLSKLKQPAAGANQSAGAGKELTPQQKMERVADFIQANRNSSLVKNSALYKKLEAVDPQQLKEAYESDILKLMKQKKISDQDIDGFIKQMSANPQAKKQLMDLGISVPNESGSTETPSQQQTQLAAGQQAQKPAAAAGTQQQPAGQEDKTQGDDGVIHVFKGKPKGPGGASLHMQLTRQFGNVPDAGKLITAISKDLLNQLKVNGLNVQESIEQVEQFLLKEVIEQNLEHNSLSFLLKENNSLDYTLTSQVFESLQEMKPVKGPQPSKFQFTKQKSRADLAKDRAAKKAAKADADKTVGDAAGVLDAQDQKEKDTEAVGQLAADTNPNATPDAPRTQSSEAPQPAQPEQSQLADNEGINAVIQSLEAVKSDIQSAAKLSDIYKIAKKAVSTVDTKGFDDKAKGFANAQPENIKKILGLVKQYYEVVNISGAGEKRRQLEQEMMDSLKLISNSGGLRTKALDILNNSDVLTDDGSLEDEPEKQAEPTKSEPETSTATEPESAPEAPQAKEPEQPKAEPTSGPQQSGQMIGRQQQISKAADAAFKQMTPAKAGVINVGEIVGRKLKAMAQLNRKAGLALEPMVPKMLKAIEKFIGYALAKSGKKDVKIVGGSKNAAALQKTVKQAAMGDKGAIKAGVDAMKAQQDKKQAIKEALVEEIYNLLTGKTE
jgi:hypothetical protein